MNAAIPNTIDCIKNHKNKYIFLRNYDDNKGYWGLEHLDASLYKEVFFIGGLLHNVNIEVVEYLDSEKYVNQENLVPTTGFIAWRYFLHNKKYFKQSKVTLVNFFGKCSIDIDQPFWSGHNWELEQKIYKDNNVLMIQLLDR
ncbi:hypothetical protein UFOVP49_46 [uncultured Caudovirales phage]|uniref:Uncharacterized protein n=1 Tax=uncultured Caudovirales phage TaxID=2100421 RepID=A0A6J5KVW4_9CAUD|nr:hypothetical protein UFOVP49_46 [uncultured Caudovirales phage]